MGLREIVIAPFFILFNCFCFLISFQLNFNVKEYFQNKRKSDNFHLLKNLKDLRKPVDKYRYGINCAEEKESASYLSLSYIFTR